MLASFLKKLSKTPTTSPENKEILHKPLSDLDNNADNLSNPHGILRSFLKRLSESPTTKPENKEILNQLLSDLDNNELDENILNKVEEIGLLKELLLQKDPYGYTPLQKAIFPRDIRGKALVGQSNHQLAENILDKAQEAGILKELLLQKDRYGYNLLDNTILPQDGYRKTLSNQSNHELVEKILEKAQEAEVLDTLLLQEDRYGNTPLHKAIDQSNHELVEKILEKAQEAEVLGTLLLQEGKCKKYPLIRAIGRLDYELVEILLKKAQEANALDKILKQGDKRGDTTPLHEAIDRGNNKLAEMLIEKAQEANALDKILKQGDKRGDTPLHNAIDRGNNKLAEMLIEKAQEANALDKILLQKNTFEYTPLDRAIERSNNKLAEMLIEKAQEAGVLKEVLLQKENFSRYTPLHRAIKRGNNKLAEMLIEKAKETGVLEEVLLEKSRFGGDCPLKYILQRARTEDDHREYLKLFIEAGFDYKSAEADRYLPPALEQAIRARGDNEDRSDAAYNFKRRYQAEIKEGSEDHDQKMSDRREKRREARADRMAGAGDSSFTEKLSKREQQKAR
ncbi:ankyrin repeat domain-containing protein [Rickettsiales bacterium]|nr:ankyrin repeat domain-containing protein [Rickettsiales bacterium]